MVGYSPEEDWYRIEYDDGSKEDYNRKQLEVGRKLFNENFDITFCIGVDNNASTDAKYNHNVGERNRTILRKDTMAAELYMEGDCEKCEMVTEKESKVSGNITMNVVEKGQWIPWSMISEDQRTTLYQGKVVHVYRL